MKQLNLKIAGTLAFSLLTASTFAQNWRVGGNTNAQLGGNPPNLGTTQNTPLNFITNGVNRTRLNGNLTQLINGVNQSVNGYFGIAPNGFFANNSPWAMLHLDGPNTSGNLGNGWRRWMQTGLLMREESDVMYVGLQRLGNNRSDAIVSWSDDAGGAGGVDKLRFLFTGNASSGNGEGTSNMNGASLNGYEFMRMQAVPIFNAY